jgi:hypothetical protein
MDSRFICMISIHLIYNGDALRPALFATTPRSYCRCGVFATIAIAFKTMSSYKKNSIVNA